MLLKYNDLIFESLINETYVYYIKDFKDILVKMSNLQQNQIAKARMQFLQRIFKSSDVPTVVTKAIQAGLLKQGAGTNLLKYYAQDRELGKNEFNMNLPILGKTPMFYFFSIFSNYF